MKKNTPDKWTRQARFMRSCVNTFSQHKELTRLTVQNALCAVTVSREYPEAAQTHAIGFDIPTANDEYCDD